MLVNLTHGTRREHRRLALAGVVFMTLLASLVALSLAIYGKVFQASTDIVLEADRAGLQLTQFGDVRVNGALVGQVRGIDQDGDVARITLAIEPDAARAIPADVRAEILPTTLFGQKFVSLVSPEDPSDDPISDGDVVPADRVETNVELNRILAELFPLLRSIRPADLNATLNALATALEGRGDQLGSTLVDLGDYLGEVEDVLPTLREDLDALADVADAYDDAAPDLLDVLDNLTVTSRTVVDKRRDLDTFFSDVQGLSDTTTRVLRDNETDLIQVGEVTAPVMQLLATYSPQLPCLLEGAKNYEPRLAKSFEGNQVKPIGPQPLSDGSDKDSDPPTSVLPYVEQQRGLADPVSSGTAGTAGDQQVLNALLAGVSGRPAHEYGALGSLLYGPLVRGTA